MSSDLDRAFQLASDGQNNLDAKQYRDAAICLVQAVGLFEKVIDTVKDSKSRKLIETQTQELREKAVSAQDMANAQVRTTEERLAARIEKLKASSGKMVPAMSDLSNRLEKLRGPQKPAPSVGSIEERFNALRGPPKRVPEATEIAERLAALGPSQFTPAQQQYQVETTSASRTVDDAQLNEVVGGLMATGMDDVDESELRSLVKKALALDLKGNSIDVDVLSNQYTTLLGSGLDNDIDGDEVELIMQQARDELIYANDSSTPKSTKVDPPPSSALAHSTRSDESDDDLSEDESSDDSSSSRKKQKKKSKKKKKKFGFW